MPTRNRYGDPIPRRPPVDVAAEKTKIRRILHGLCLSCGAADDDDHDPECTNAGDGQEHG